MRPLRIGVNALYLIPGGVGGTEIYLRELLRALAELDARNEYFIFTNRETGPDLVPRQRNFQGMPQRVRARFRPARMVWEQTALPLAALRLGLDALLNPGFTAPVYCPCAAVTVFHDMQHKRHPEHFRWFDLPFWRLLLFVSAHAATMLLANSETTRTPEGGPYQRKDVVFSSEEQSSPFSAVFQSAAGTGVAFTGVGLFDAVATRGRHVGWPLLAGIGIAALLSLRH